MKLKIKNMVCNRCIRVLSDELTSMGFIITSIHLGEVNILESPNKAELISIETMLQTNGFDLLKDKKAEIIEQVKSEIIGLIYKDTDWDKLTLSYYLESRIGKEYHYISNLFSSVESITIEKFMIVHKIERVKEFIVYDELNFSEIAFKLGYSSVQHLSNQFKKMIGLTPSQFKKNQKHARKKIDEIIK